MVRLLRIESMKLMHDRAFHLGLGVLLGSPAVVGLSYLSGRSELVSNGMWNADVFISRTLFVEALLLAPMVAAIVGAHLVTAEYRYKTLKALLPLPISHAGLFATKGILGLVSLGLAMLATGMVTLLASMGLGLRPTVAEAGYRGLLLTVLRRQSLLSATLWADLAFAVAVSLVGRNFVVPLGAAAVAQVAAMLALQGDKGHLLWASLPGLVLGKAAQGQPVLPQVLTSLAYTCVFTAGGCAWARFTPRPE